MTRNISLPGLFLLGIVALMAYMLCTVVLEASRGLVGEITGVKVSDHGLEKHSEAAALEASCNADILTVKKWKDRWEKGKYYLFCKMEDGKYGIIPVVLEAGRLVGKTAFSPGNGSFNAVRSYLDRLATPYGGALK